MTVVPPPIDLHVLDGLTVSRGGKAIELPKSKKTRSLLAYLALTPKPTSRDRLCSLLWDLPDDPRGALRWSLSKIRPVVDEPGVVRLIADRTNVALDTADMRIDFLELKALTDSGLDTVSTEMLEAMAAGLRGRPFADLDCLDQLQFQAWLTAVREDARRRTVDVLTEIVKRKADATDQGLDYALHRLELEPLSEAARICVIKVLLAMGRSAEAAQHYQAGLKEFGRHKLEPGPDYLQLAKQLDAPAAARTVQEAPVAATPPALEEAAPQKPDLPSIAVLPFENLSGDPAQDYFADGVTDGTIGAISAIAGLFVIGRSSIQGLSRPDDGQPRHRKRAWGAVPARRQHGARRDAGASGLPSHRR